MLHGTAVFYANIYYHTLQLEKHTGHSNKTKQTAYLHSKWQSVFKQKGLNRVQARELNLLF